MIESSLQEGGTIDYSLQFVGVIYKLKRDDGCFLIGEHLAKFTFWS